METDFRNFIKIQQNGKNIIHKQTIQNKPKKNIKLVQKNKNQEVSF